MEEVLDEGFNTWKDYGLPLFPVLPGSAPRDEIDRGPPVRDQPSQSGGD